MPPDIRRDAVVVALAREPKHERSESKSGRLLIDGRQRSLTPVHIGETIGPRRAASSSTVHLADLVSMGVDVNTPPGPDSTRADVWVSRAGEGCLTLIRRRSLATAQLMRVASCTTTPERPSCAEYPADDHAVLAASRQELSRCSEDCTTRSTRHCTIGGAAERRANYGAGGPAVPLVASGLAFEVQLSQASAHDARSTPRAEGRIPCWQS